MTKMFITLFAVFPAACATTTSSEPTKIIDLTQTLDASNGLRMEPKNLDGPGFSVKMADVTMFNHGSTHYDPPSHIMPNGKGADQVDIAKLVGPARVLDFRSKARDAGLTRADFAGQVKAGDFVIAFTGCPPRAGQGDPPPCPYLAPDGAEYLASLPVRAFATDGWTMSNMTPANAKHFMDEMQAGKTFTPEGAAPEHFALLSKDIPAFEGVTNLEALLPEKRVTIVALPLKLKDATGAPARVIAIVY